MGDHQVNSAADEARLRVFMKSLLADVNALERMLESDIFESGVRRIGAEQEMFLVDSAGRPANRAVEVMRRLDHPSFTHELALFNLEANLQPQVYGGSCLRLMEQELRGLMAKAYAAAEQEGCDLALCGILPTLKRSDVGLESMTPNPRYLALNDAMMRLRGGQFHFRIKGHDEFEMTHDNVMLESCNTSFQVHFQVGVDEFARLYNLAQAITGPVMAVAVNSPMLLGRRLWSETRVALFQQSVDARSTAHQERGLRPRVSFGDAWVEKSVLEIFKEDIARFRVVLASDPEDDPMEVLDRGEVPKLKALCMHNGTVYRWNRPVEIWTYPGSGAKAKSIDLVLFEPKPGQPWQIWSPSLLAKAELMQETFVYYLEQWEQSNGKVFHAERFDFQVCRRPAELMDEATGIRVLTDRFRKPPPPGHLDHLLRPPADLAAWSIGAMATVPEPEPPELVLESMELQFPAMRGQRIVSRLVLMLPPEAGYAIDTEEESPVVRLVAEVLVEQEGRPFETHISRFILPAPKENRPLPIVLERPLRPGKRFLLRLRLRDEIGGAELRLTKAVIVPLLPEKLPETPVDERVLIELEESLAKATIEGADSLLLVPPTEDVVVGLYRAEVLVTGPRIAKVIFLVDDERQLSRTRKPWAAELRLPSLPVELVVRAEGHDGAGELVAADELILNQPRGMLRVRIVEPRRDASVVLPVDVRVEVTLPEGKTVERVEFTVDGEIVVTDTRPPWQASIGSSENSSMPTYISVTAFLDDGSRAEDLRFLGIDAFSEEVQVRLVELYTAATDSSGRMVRDLEIGDFEIFEDGRLQKLEKMELVENLPLTVAVVMDTSTSMEERIEEAKSAASRFLEQVVRKGDRAFAVAFASRASLLTPPTEDAKAVSLLISRQKAYGWTALHDALLTSLFYFRGYRGQRALVLLSDGDDTKSATGFKEALEYARRAGVAIYPIGIEISKVEIEVRRKLNRLAEATGGRAFYVTEADELAEVYEDIELELRSRYLLTYVPSQSGKDGEFREIEVKVRRRGVETRTIRGYYP